MTRNGLRNPHWGIVAAVLCVSAWMITPPLVGGEKQPAASAQAASRPNILFIFADDQCFETIHALGNERIETPHLDRLVRHGVTFTHAYNQGSWTGAVCVASRTMLTTGSYLWHAQRIHEQRTETERQAGRFWPEYMKRAGYDTYFSGKWHIRADVEKAFHHVAHVRPGMPNQTPAGYNRPLAPGEPGGSTPRLTGRRARGEEQRDTWKPWDHSFGGYWKGGRHWSEVLADDAEGFLGQAAQQDRPFFMYLAFNAAHDPRQSPKRYVDKYPLSTIRVPENYLPEYPFKDAMGCGKDLRDERLAPFPRTEYAVKVHRQEYYALITHMDAQIGRILAALEKTGKAENTWIFFTADHGLAVGHHGLMGKQNMFDHSVRVPLIVVGPQAANGGPGVPQDVQIDTPVYLQDIMPTTLELAGVPKPEHVQFTSLLPLIRGNRTPIHEAIYGAYLDRQRMVTQGEYKLILYPTINKVLLFNLKQDPQEMHNLVDEPESRPVVKRLFSTLKHLQTETGDQLDLAQAFPNLE